MIVKQGAVAGALAAAVLGLSGAAWAACESGAAQSITLAQLPLFDAKPAHPLAGHIYDVHAPTAALDPCPDVALGTLADRLRALLEAPGEAPRLIVLGEVHDNPAVHALRAALMRSILRAPLAHRPALVFEHFRADKQPALDAINADVAKGETLSADAVLDRLEWRKSGWPDQSMFRPLFAVALDEKLRMVAGDATRDAMRVIAFKGLDALPAQERTRLKLDRPLAPDLQDDLLAELEDSHCGIMRKEQFTGMADAQRFRDATLAAALAGAAKATAAAILLAGNEHGRTDRGVPGLFGPQGLPGSVTSVAFVEVEDGKTEPAEYVTKDPSGKPAIDVVVFVPRAAREDPCEAMRKRFTQPPHKSP